MNNRFIIYLILSWLSFVASAQVTLGFKGESTATVGVYVRDLQTNNVIASNKADILMTPASVMKLVTAASVYTTIEHDSTFQTHVYLTAPVTDGICKGNLLIKSCADPTIDSSQFSERPSFITEIAEALLIAGVKSITGDIIVEQSLSDAGCVAQWEIDDVPWSYGAGLYGFNYRDNTFRLWPATKRTEPFVPNLNLTVKQGRSVDMSRGVDSNKLLVVGPKPNNPAWQVTTTMWDPASVFVHELRTYLSSDEIGISIGGASVPDSNSRQLLMTHFSEPIDDILHQMMIVSHNMYAEAMLRLLLPDSSRQEAIDYELKLWSNRGLSTGNLKILDGSGLARADKLRPSFIANVLQWMAEGPYAAGYAALFPRAGVEGTVKSLLKDTPLQGKLGLKSGSMSGVQCFAGYKFDDDDNPTHVVVIIVNSFTCDRASVRKSIENFLLKTFNN